jgi:uncharacterized protein
LDCLRTIFWQNTHFPGAEVCSLCREGVGYILSGAILAVLDARPIRAVYRVDADADWRTRTVRINMVDAEVDHCLSLTADGKGRWFDGERELEELNGCLDIDLELTPSTNTLPINRLKLRIGARQTLDAAWVRFPDFQIERLAQRYVRLSEVEYRYESAVSGFKARLSVDEFGLVEEYEGVWLRAAG